MFKRWITGVAACLGLVLLLATQARAVESHVHLANKSDAWVLITMYSGTGCYKGVPGMLPTCNGIVSIGTYCVAPGQSDQHDVRVALYKVRAEATHRGCAQPVMMDRIRRFPYDGKSESLSQEYHVYGSAGTYVF